MSRRLFKSSPILAGSVGIGSNGVQEVVHVSTASQVKCSSRGTSKALQSVCIVQCLGPFRIVAMCSENRVRHCEKLEDFPIFLNADHSRQVGTGHYCVLFCPAFPL